MSSVNQSWCQTRGTPNLGEIPVPFLNCMAPMNPFLRIADTRKISRVVLTE